MHQSIEEKRLPPYRWLCANYPLSTKLEPFLLIFFLTFLESGRPNAVATFVRRCNLHFSTHGCSNRYSDIIILKWCQRTDGNNLNYFLSHETSLLVFFDVVCHSENKFPGKVHLRLTYIPTANRWRDCHRQMLWNDSLYVGLMTDLLSSGILGILYMYKVQLYIFDGNCWWIV